METQDQIIETALNRTFAQMGFNARLMRQSIMVALRANGYELVDGRPESREEKSADRSNVAVGR